MTSIHAIFLPDTEVLNKATPILKHDFSRFGFSKATVRDEEDFDGAHVLRVDAHVNEEVPTAVLVATLARIQTELRRLGDERFVYLSTIRPETGEVEDEDEG